MAPAECVGLVTLQLQQCAPDTLMPETAVLAVAEQHNF
jgi:hypothetical protein